LLVEYQEYFENQLNEYKNFIFNEIIPIFGGSVPSKDDFTSNPFRYIGSMIGIDSYLLYDLNLDVCIKSFEKGDFGILFVNNPEFFYNVNYFEGRIYNPNDSKIESKKSFSIEVGAVINRSEISRFWRFSHHPAPSILVSNSFVLSYINDYKIIEILINANLGYEIPVTEEIENLVNNVSEILLVPQFRNKLETYDLIAILTIIGNFLTIFFGTLYAINFINIISTNLVTRKLELVTLECIGMNRHMLRKLLIYEGLWYGLISIFLSITIGHIFIFTFYKLISLTNQGRWLQFSYPFMPVLLGFVIALLSSILIPKILISRNFNKPLFEQLKDIEF